MSDEQGQSVPGTMCRPGMFTDPWGKPSMMRLMSLVSLVASIWFGWLTINDANPTTDAGIYITSAFLLAAFAPKSLNKFIEHSYPLGK